MMDKIISGKRRWYATRVYNGVLDRVRTRPVDAVVGDLPALNEIKQRAARRSDISDHLPTMFVETLRARPRLIVELGVRRGESTFVFERVARLTGATIVSCDLNDCSGTSAYEKRHFVQGDDVEFARRFPEWCRERGIRPEIDVLFIDTSHFYDHTVAEIDAWFPFLSEQGKVILHDTNLTYTYFRKDGSIGFAMECERGVIRALEGFFGKNYDETRDFIDVQGGWLIQHWAKCCGLTILDRIPLKEGAGR